ncbi:MAG: YceI family protein [Bacteroidales bacterium]|nr:YceI family protein [Bacteroidales bacterium]MDT8431129.1 YceI family protein [Bacteroidales bacterium]
MKKENTTKWVIDASHSEVSFKVKHMMISTVTGYFENFNATAETDGDDFNNAAIEVSIDTGSVNTKNSDRDTHLKSDDFFNAEKFPEMVFTSTSFKNGILTGDLTIRDVTKEVSLEADFNGIAVDPYGQTKAGFELTGEINRKDFGLKWSAVTEAGNVVVSDTVKLVIDVQFIRQ